MSERKKSTRRKERAIIGEKIEEDASIGRKRSAAQRRWRILAKALTTGSGEGEDADEEEEISVRRFAGFDLLRPIWVEKATGEPAGSGWYEYSAVLENEPFSVQIRRLKSNGFTANELIGFNNTGNVCVWPSEECLAYYLLKNREICRGRRVLELGGGMSCLAGLIAGKYCGPSGVTVTDGNATSVDNVRRIISRNGLADSVECAVVRWAKAAEAIGAFAAPPPPRVHDTTRVKSRMTGGGDCNGGGDEAGKISEKPYDVILCADCLFFDEARLDLVETIYGWLANDGLALVMAPGRGSTFEKFAEAAMKRGFVARRIDRYDGRVWSRHLELLEHSREYRPDLHYPILLELTKRRKTLPG